jgi:hypothetical protein
MTTASKRHAHPIRQDERREALWVRGEPAFGRLQLVVALVAPHDIYVYGPLFAVFRGDGYCLRLATPVANNGRREAGCDLTNGAVGISI